MEIIINEQDFKKRLDVFITQYLENKYPRTKISALIDNGIILINNKGQKSSYKLKKGDVINLEKENIEEFLNENETLKPWDYELNIVFEDDYLMVINKSKNMLTHPTKYEREKTLCNALIYHTKTLSDISGQYRLGIVHRLDKNTAGLIICAKTNEAHKNLARQIREKTARRKYLAIALGEFEKEEDTINKPLVHYIKEDVKMTVAKDGNGLEAITCYKVIENFKGASLVELELKTGRTHQIRAHLSSINHPVFGDSLYGAGGFTRNEYKKLKTQEQLLESYYLSFIHPKSGKKMEFQLELDDFSPDFIKVLNFLRSEKNEH